MIRALLSVKSRIARNKLFSYRAHSRLKGAVIGLFLLTYLVGGYFLLREGFSFVQGFPFVGDLLLDRVVDLFFFALFVMLVTSQALFAYGSFFRSKEISYLRTLPLPSSAVFAWEFWESTLLSSWTFLFVSVPMLIAYAQVRGIFFSFVGLFFLLFIPLVVLCGVFGTLVPFAAVAAWRSRWRWLWIAAGAMVLGVGGFFAVSLRTQTIVEPVMNQILDKMLWHTRFAQWPWWPSAWVSRSILGFLRGDISVGVGYLWFLWISAGFFVQALLLGGGRLLEMSFGWESSRRCRRCKRYARLDFLHALLKPFLNADGAGIVVKDIKTFVRDPAQWSHFAIFFGLLAIYFGNLRNLHYDVMGIYWKYLVTFLNLTTVGLVAGTLATRFFFPLPSLEIRHRWIWGVGGAGKILLPKFAAGFLFLLVVTETLMKISCGMLRWEQWITDLCMAAVFLMCLAMMALCLGLGAAFPSPKEELSAKIVSGFGGTLCLILILGYLAVVVLSVAIPVQLFIVRRLITGQVFAGIMAGVGIFVVALSLGLVVGCMYLGNKAMRRTEF